MMENVNAAMESVGEQKVILDRISKVKSIVEAVKKVSEAAADVSDVWLFHDVG